MTKGDAQRLKGLFMSAEGNIASLKGQSRNTNKMNVEEMRCLVVHWQNAGKEILEILGEAPNPNQQTFNLDLDPIMANGKEAV